MEETLGTLCSLFDFYNGRVVIKQLPQVTRKIPAVFGGRYKRPDVYVEEE